jgi:hypothetical protein
MAWNFSEEKNNAIEDLIFIVRIYILSPLKYSSQQM